MKAEKVFINGNIYTMKDDKFHAEALATAGQEILAVGSTAEVMELFGTDTEVIALEGKSVIPGLIDSHIHTLIAADMFDKDHLVNCFDKSKEEIVAEVKRLVEMSQPGEWIQGLGWNQSGWVDTTLPTKEELDVVSPENPVVLLRVCGHAYWANSKAVEIAGVTRDTKAPMGGEILKDANGEPTGYFTEKACDFIGACIPDLTKEDIMRKFLLIQDYMLENGVTAYSDKCLGAMSIGHEAPVKATMEALDELYSDGQMKVRMNTFIKSAPVMEEIYKEGPKVGLYDGRLTHRGLKLFSDGALGARSAWLLEEYNDRPGHTG
ncbi:MAG: amidohydrolase family protein, partial [Firmicutes bacterium]|nr:amidohydrolase family protein [Bacillota bacterium]